jgi:type II secretory pathway predicted ATPase ExeA
MNYIQFSGFTSEPFSNEIATKYLMKLNSNLEIKNRFEYVFNCGGVFVLTGDVGSGKSTALRFTESQFHPSQYHFINILASGGSIIEFYRQLCWGVDIEITSGTRTTALKKFKTAVLETSKTKKQKIIVVIDEAHLLRPEIFNELHIITQFSHDSQNVFSIALVGQANLIDKLTYRTSAALASRVITRTHISHLTEPEVNAYLEHRLNISGIKTQLFSPQAIVAIYQGSSGILRRVNLLARGGLVAAASEKQNLVSAEHIRIASTELI